MNNTVALTKIRQEILDNNVCPALAEQATQLVFGAGNTNAKIVFIGEAPGKKEDETGLPFVGASGKFLDELLLSIGLKREDVYITNIVKYRPPNNRDPSKAEKAEFLPYLMQQLDIIKPKVVVTLGRHSMEQFLPEMKISQAHGQKFTIKALGDKDQSNKTQSDSKMQANTDEIILIPLYHPAAALYNGSMRQILQDDFANLKQFL